MADRPVIKTVTSGAVFDTDTLNENFTKLRNAFDDLVSRRGTAAANNVIEGDLDFAGNGARNLGVISPIGGPTETVGTIGQLRASENPEGSIVQVLGYLAAGDGGGGLFRLDTASSEADNSYSVIVDASGNRWKRLYDRLTPTMCGGIGDGVADDTGALSTILSNTSTYGVLENAKTYLVSELQVNNTFKLQGTGKIECASIDESAILVDTPSEDPLVEDCFIADVTFSQPKSPNFAGGSANNHSMMKFRGVKNARAHNLNFKGGDLCLHFGRGGTSEGGWTQSYDCFSSACSGDDISGMFLELFGVIGGSHLGHRATGTGSNTTTSISASDVNTSNDTWTIDSDLAFNTGDKVRVSSTGTLPSPLQEDTDYWVIKSGSTVKFATSYRASALAASPLDITTQGSGIHTLTKVRAASHGVRMASVDASLGGATYNMHMQIEASINTFRTGISIQYQALYNDIVINSTNCLFGVELHGRTIGSVPVASLSKYNNITIHSKGDDFAVMDYGGSYNNYYVIADDFTSGGIFLESDGGTPGYSTNNTYKGTLTNGRGRLLEIKGDNTTLDIDAQGVNTTEATNGIILSGDNCRGRVSIDTVASPATISGSNIVLTLQVRNCISAVTIPGSNCVITIDTDGDVTDLGSNNKIIGRIGGTLTRSSTGDYSGLYKSRTGTAASAITLVLPALEDVVVVTGTTNITSISSSGNNGRRVTLIFEDALTLTDGGNLRLTSDLTTAANTSLTLVCVGTVWYEVSRSAN